MNNLPKVVTQQRRGRALNPRLLDRKSDAVPLSHRATHLCEAVTFDTTTRGLGGLRLFPVFSSLYQIEHSSTASVAYQLHIIRCGTIITSTLQRVNCPRYPDRKMYTHSVLADFLSRDAMYSAACRALSVRLSITFVYYILLFDVTL